jgi:Sigma-70 factor, region 1.1
MASKQIDDVPAMFSEMGVNVVETEETSEEGEEAREEADEEVESEGGDALTPSQERKYKKLKYQIIEAKALRKLKHPSRSRILRSFLES